MIVHIPLLYGRARRGRRRTAQSQGPRHAGQGLEVLALHLQRHVPALARVGPARADLPRGDRDEEGDGVALRVQPLAEVAGVRQADLIYVYIYIYMYSIYIYIYINNTYICILIIHIYIYMYIYIYK